MNAPRFRSLAVLTVLASTLAFGANEEVIKPLKTTMQAVRYGKYSLAIKQFASEEQGKYLLGDDWAKATPAQRQEFTQLFQILFAKIAFPKVEENFKHLDSVLYDEPKVEGDRADVGSTVVILHPMKKQEIKLKYWMVKDKGTWKVVDVTVLGDSMLMGIRDDQIRPIMKEGGWDNLLKLMRVKAKELEKVPFK